MILDTNPQMLSDAIEATSQSMGINPLFVEKDYWITKLLMQLSRSEYASNCVFKGGSALSKAHKLISRFSEDIDVAVITEQLSGNQVKNLISRVCKQMTQGLSEVEVEGLTSKGSRYRKSLYKYPATRPKSPFVADQIIVEVNSFGNPYPFEQKTISSFIGDYMAENGMTDMIEEYDMHPFQLNVLSSNRTLCEKMVSLIRFSFEDDAIAGLTSKVRHFYDLFYILKSDATQRYIQTEFPKDLNALIAHDKDVFDIPPRWKLAATSSSVLFTDFSGLWNKIAPIYERELSTLAYRAIPGKDEIIADLEPFFHQVKEMIDE